MSTQKTGIQFAPEEHMWTLSVLAPGGTGVFTVPLRTDSRGEGLWVGNRQVLGAAQFQLPASESARKRKMVWAANGKGARRLTQEESLQVLWSSDYQVFVPEHLGRYFRYPVKKRGWVPTPRPADPNSCPRW